MAVLDIPAKRVVTCDGCGKEAEGSVPGAWAVLHVKQSALDWNNTPCADASVSLQLCDECKSPVIAAMNEAIQTRRAKLAQVPQ